MLLNCESADSLESRHHSKGGCVSRFQKSPSGICKMQESALAWLPWLHSGPPIAGGEETRYISLKNPTPALAFGPWVSGLAVDPIFETRSQSTKHWLHACLILLCLLRKHRKH